MRWGCYAHHHHYTPLHAHCVPLLTLALIPTLARTLHTRTRQPLTLTLTLTRTLHPLVTRTPIHPPYPRGNVTPTLTLTLTLT